MKLRILIPLIIFVVVCLASALAERPGGFRIVGPGGGGAMFNPTISPHDFNTVLISCDMTGSYITHDGGRTWRMFNLRGVVNFFVFDPHDAKTMYAHATGLWRSRDDGETWALVSPAPSTVRGVKMSSDHADETIVAPSDPLGGMYAMAIDPADSRLLYVVAGRKENPNLFVSRDSGEHWRKQADLPSNVRRLWVDPHSKPRERRLFVGAANSLTTVAGARVRTLPLPATAKDFSLGFGSGEQPMIYFTSERGAFRSSDGGATWRECVLPGSGAKIRAVATSLHHPDTAYLSYSDLKLGWKTWLGIAKTTNAGDDWQLVWKESSGPAQNVHDDWITDRFGVTWGENPLNMTVADQDPNLAYGTDLGRTMRTTDGGATWDGVYSRKVDDEGWSTVGLDVTTNYGVHFDPFDPKRIFITYTDIGAFRSEDGGTSWTSATMGVPDDWTNTTYWMVFDPKVKGRAWSVNSGTHDLPRPKMWRHTAVSAYKGGVCRSDDSGKTWAKSNDGMDETAATHILLDPTSPVDARVLYVSGFGRGVYKSVDGGRTWKLKNQGITQSEPFAWRLTRGSDGTLYVLLARRSEDGSIGNARDGALYRSSDGAEHWEPVALPSGVNAPNGLAADPESPQRLYLAAWARAVGEHGEGGGIYLSENGGKSWHSVFDRDQHVYDLTIDPNNANVLYAAGFESSVWRSADKGEHWKRVPGFNFKWAHRVIPDPQDRDQIYVTTFGGSVWHGSVRGQDKPVDIVTPALEPGQ
ncbi:MAG: WD40/YVTN/BNR-like repeat-containing protein [Candidatus Sulfotelmatobacter sp.]